MSGFYVYGVVAAGSAVPASPVAVRLVECGSLAAVVGDVSLEEFGEDALARNLNDREWLEAHARTHDAVLHAFVGVTPVVPLRFGAIYRTEDEVRRMLETRREFFETTLAQLRGRVEMGVKAWIDRAAFQRQLARRGAAEEVASGRGYLERRQSELAAAGEASRRVAELARAESRAATRAHRSARRDDPQRGLSRPGGRLEARRRGRTPFRGVGQARRQLRGDGPMAAVQLRTHRGAGAMSVVERPPLEQQVTLVELVDRVLGKGVVITGDITLSVAGVDLVYVGLRVLLSSVSALESAR